MRSSRSPIHPFLPVLLAFLPHLGWSQVYGPPDRGAPWDERIQEYLAGKAEQLHAKVLEGVTGAEKWNELRPRYQEEYFHMLGLWPLPEKTPLEATVTGTLQRDGYVIEKLHYQSRPGLYVTGNLYRPKKVEPGAKLLED